MMAVNDIAHRRRPISSFARERRLAMAHSLPRIQHAPANVGWACWKIKKQAAWGQS